jgi:RNA polymerase sigma factor (sigma-70 family)
MKTPSAHALAPTRPAAASRPPRDRTDAELLADCQAGIAERAFEEIVTRHGPLVFRTCLRMLGNVHEAEDAAQAAFVVLARKPHAVRSALPVWLHWVARNTAYKVIRARTRRTRHEQEAAKTMTRIDTAAGTALLREELDLALGRLPDPLRQAVILRYLEGRTQEEAARLAGCPQGTLARRSMEGLERLRALLRKRGLALGSVALAGLLAQEATAATPLMPLLLLKLAAARTAPNASAVVWADSVLQTMYWAKLKSLGFAVATVLTLALTGTVAVKLAGLEGAARIEGPTARPASGLVPPASPFRLHIVPKADEKNFCPADVVVFAPDGQTLAAGRCDGTVRLWDANTGQQKASLRGHVSRTRAVAFSPDGKTLASSSFDGILKLWNPTTQREAASIKAHSQMIWSLAFASDGKTLATAAWDGTIKLWDTAPLRERTVLKGHAGRVNAVAFAPRAPGLLASGGGDGTVKLWNLTAATVKLTLAEGMGEVSSVAFTADGRFLAAASLMNDIRIWEIETGRERQRLGKSGATALAFSPGGATLAAAALDNTTTLWDWHSGKTGGSVAPCGGWSATFSPKGNALAVAGFGHVRVLDPAVVSASTSSITNR